MNNIELIGVFLNVSGAILLAIDAARIISIMSKIVKHLANNHGTFDTLKVKQEKLEILATRITVSKFLTPIGILLTIIGACLQSSA